MDFRTETKAEANDGTKETVKRWKNEKKTRRKKTNERTNERTTDRKRGADERRKGSKKRKKEKKRSRPRPALPATAHAEPHLHTAGRHYHKQRDDYSCVSLSLFLLASDWLWFH